MGRMEEKHDRRTIWQHSIVIRFIHGNLSESVQHIATAPGASFRCAPSSRSVQVRGTLIIDLHALRSRISIL